MKKGPTISAAILKRDKLSDEFSREHTGLAKGLKTKDEWMNKISIYQVEASMIQQIKNERQIIVGFGRVIGTNLSLGA